MTNKRSVPTTASGLARTGLKAPSGMVPNCQFIIIMEHIHTTIIIFDIANRSFHLPDHRLLINEHLYSNKKCKLVNKV